MLTRSHTSINALKSRSDTSQVVFSSFSTFVPIKILSASAVERLGWTLRLTYSLKCQASLLAQKSCDLATETQ